MSAFTALLCFLFTCVRAAWAADAHGVAVAPCATEFAAPVVAWSSGLAAAGARGACVTGEYAKQPVVALFTDGEGSRLYSPVDDLWGAHVGGTWGFGRVGVGVDVPVWLSFANDDVVQPSALGDARIYAPFAVVVPAREGALAVDAVAELVLPTGNAEALLGAGSAGGAAHLVIAQRGDRLGGNVDFGVGYTGGTSLTGLDTSLWTRLALSGDWRPHTRFGLGGELWFQASPLSSATFVQASPGEALLRASASLTDQLWVSLAGGTAITPGVGAAVGRAYLRVGWSERPAPKKLLPVEATTVVVPPPPGPWDVLVSVRDDAGSPLDARVSVVGEAPPEPQRAGEDGDARVGLRPGRFTLVVEAEGYGTQRRALDLAADRFRPERVMVVLQRREGDASLRLEVADSEGRNVGGAIITVDGKQLGQTASGGQLEVEGVLTGPRSLVVGHPDFRAQGAREVLVPQAPGDAARIVLERPPGSVRVVTRGANGPVADARVRFSGPEEMSAQNIGPDGERTFTLLPGHWVMVASAADLGTQEREFDVEAGRTSLVVIDVRLRESEAGQGRLVVRVVDPDGEPVDGAEVFLDGESAGRTANGGSLTLAELDPGLRKITARGEKFRDAAPSEVQVGEGAREVTMGLRWRAGQVHLRTRGLEGAMLDARVRFSGPEDIPAQGLGPDGEAWFELAPGSWTLAISSPTYGMQQREVEVRPNDVSLVEISAGLLTEDGKSAVAVQVNSSLGGALNGAVVEVDGKEVGTTASTGRLEVGGLRTGAHKVRVTAPGHRAREHAVVVKGERFELASTLDALGRRLDVRAVANLGPATDAVVRGYGVGSFPAAGVDADGRRVITVEPGDWTLVAVSTAHGIAQQELGVTAGSTPMPVELRLGQAAPTTGSLLIEVVDPAGRAIAGATIIAGGTVYEAGADGLLLLSELAAGPLPVAVNAPGFKPRAAEPLSVVAGAQTSRLRLEWVARPVRVAVVDAKGRAVDAEVRAIGPGRTEPVRSGTAGANLALMPGDWQLVASAEGFGPWRLDLPVTVGTARVDVKAVLGAGKVELTETSVVIRERVNFAFDKADIDPGSYALLEQVASTLLLHPELTNIEVRGHTDDRGGEAYNLDLSQRRAEAVRGFLIRRGVEPARVESRGFGATLPVASNTSESGRAANRRVEFEIVTLPSSPAP
jgi:outer membrane protein OmpA-like peptidoglycan-associated protein